MSTKNKITAKQACFTHFDSINEQVGGLALLQYASKHDSDVFTHTAQLQVIGQVGYPVKTGTINRYLEIYIKMKLNQVK